MWASGFSPPSCPTQFAARLSRAWERMLNPSAGGGLSCTALPGLEWTTLSACSIGLPIFARSSLQKKTTFFLSENKGNYTAWQADLLCEGTHLPLSFCAWPNATCMKSTTVPAWQPSVDPSSPSLLTLLTSQNELPSLPGKQHQTSLAHRVQVLQWCSHHQQQHTLQLQPATSPEITKRTKLCAVKGAA